MSGQYLTGNAHCSLKELFDYWLTRRGSRRMPARADINPADIPSLLPYLLLADVDACRQAVRIRLAGTGVVDRFGTELTGHDLSEVDHGEENEAVATTYMEVARLGEPQYKVSDFWTKDRRHFHMEMILLPLSEDGESVNMILTGLYCH